METLLSPQLKFSLRREKLRQLVAHISIRDDDSDKTILEKIYSTVQSHYKNILDTTTVDVNFHIFSIYLRHQGNEFYTKKQYSKALHYYNHSIILSGKMDDAYGLAVANRSAVFFELKMYNECLSDLSLVLKSQYPEKLKHKIFLRRAKCFMEMKKYSKAREALVKAENKMRVHHVNRDMLTELTLLKAKLSNAPLRDVEFEFHEDDSNISLPNLTNGENPNFAYASKCVTLRLETSGTGRVLATEDIHAGDVLFVEEPHSYILFNYSTIFSVVNCNFCGKAIHAFIICRGCNRSFYCSDTCKEKNWYLCHRWECSAWSKPYFTSSEEHALNTVLRATHIGLNTNIVDSSKYGDRSNNYPYVYNLKIKNLSPSERILNAAMAIVIVEYLSRYTDHLTWLLKQKNRPASSKNELKSILRVHLLQNLCLHSISSIIEKLCVETSEEHQVGDISCQCIGFGIFPSSYHIKHDCIANTVESYYGITKVIRATESIKKGQEIVLHKSDQRVRMSWKLKDPCMGCSGMRNHNYFGQFICQICDSELTAERNNNICGTCNERFLWGCIASDRNILKEHFYEEMSESFFYLRNYYHPDNLECANLYAYYLYHYQKNGNYVKSVEHGKLLVDLYRRRLGEQHFLHVGALVKVCFAIALSCGQLRKFKSPKLKQYYQDGLEYIENAKLLLEYHLNPRDGKILINTMFKCLEAPSLQDALHLFDNMLL